MPKLKAEIARALTETEKLQNTIAHMPPGEFKEEQKKRAHKLKGDLVKTMAKEAPNIHEC